MRTDLFLIGASLGDDLYCGQDELRVKQRTGYTLRIELERMMSF